MWTFSDLETTICRLGAHFSLKVYSFILNLPDCSKHKIYNMTTCKFLIYYHRLIKNLQHYNCLTNYMRMISLQPPCARCYDREKINSGLTRYMCVCKGNYVYNNPRYYGHLKIMSIWSECVYNDIIFLLWNRVGLWAVLPWHNVKVENRSFFSLQQKCNNTPNFICVYMICNMSLISTGELHLWWKYVVCWSSRLMFPWRKPASKQAVLCYNCENIGKR